VTTEVGAHFMDRAVASLSSLLGADRVAVAGPVYDHAASLWNAAVCRRPAVVARCLSTSDVQAAVRTAREYGLPLSVRAAGHDWAGRSLRDGGLVVDVSGMRGVTIDAAAGEATIQAGVTGTDLLTAAEPSGLAAVTGTCGGVGMIGLTLGGGYGRLCGRFGLAADNLIAAKVVLADGSLVTADGDHDPDLLWALRGGGGNFGVVTSARIRLHPMPTPLAGQVVYPLSAATTVLSRLGDLMREAPEELTVHSVVLTTPDGDRAVVLLPLWCGDPDAPHPSLQALTTLDTPLMAQLEPTPLARTAAESEQLFPPGEHVAIETRTLAAFTPEVVAALHRGGEAFTSPLSLISLHHFHGAGARVPVQDSAFAQRTPHLVAEFIARWTPGDAGAEQHRSWAGALSGDLAPAALPGGYANLLGPDAIDQIPHLYGPNTERLLAIKARVDPDNVFVATPLPEPAAEPTA
jgi:FAD binding domain-containing protein/berberine-like enzyme